MIQELQRFRKLFDQIRRGESEVDHLWFYNIYKMMPTFGFGYDTEAWKRASRLAKGIHVLIVLGLLSLWILLFGRVVTDFRNLPTDRIVECLSYCLGGTLTFFSFIRLHMKRDTLTEVIQELDRRIFAVPKDSPRSLKWWQETRQIYIWEFYILCAGCVFGLGISIPQSVSIVITGKMYHDTLIRHKATYCLSWWLELVYQGLNTLLSSLFYFPKDMMWTTIYFHLSRMYKVQAEKIMELCGMENFDGSLEYQKLKLIMNELIELDRIADKMNSIMWPYLFMLFSIGYIIISMASVSILINQEKVGWLMATLTGLMYPCFIICILSVWTTIGETYAANVQSVDDALFYCNWVEAPYEFRRLILIYKGRFQKETRIDAGPFYEMGLGLLADIFKRTYYLVTILKDVL